jgi:hypothetical protein
MVIPRQMLSRAFDGGSRAKQEEVAAAKRAAVRQDNPVQGFFQGVADAYAPKLYRFAMRTLWEEHD